jgi:hypothetical protein
VVRCLIQGDKSTDQIDCFVVIIIQHKGVLGLWQLGLVWKELESRRMRSKHSPIGHSPTSKQVVAELIYFPTIARALGTLDTIWPCLRN